jgi:eukaryotic-like serine/threonine-protein kinase
VQIGPGAMIGGKYVLERPLARGGMGSVWVARHAKLGSTVAVKFLDAHLAASPIIVSRFEREARAVATLNTPHVVQVHDYGVEDGAPYLVMELLRGEDLSARLKARGRLPLAEAGRILAQMSRALRRAHDAGIVHRDLKPANVFLARLEEDEEIVKILDFGIAKETWARADESTKTGEVFGSPHYMSPEQARAEKTVDRRADIWAVGVIAYRMLTGCLPFPGQAVGEVLSHVLVDPRAWTGAVARPP